MYCFNCARKVFRKARNTKVYQTNLTVTKNMLKMFFFGPR